MKKLLLTFTLILNCINIKSMNDINPKIFFGASIATGILGIGSLFFSKYIYTLANDDHDEESVNYNKKGQKPYWNVLKERIQKMENLEIPNQNGNESNREYIQRIVLKYPNILEDIELEDIESEDGENSFLKCTLHFAKKDAVSIKRKNHAKNYFNGGIFLLLASVSSTIGGYLYCKDGQEA